MTVERALVLGGTGFIGRHLVHRLVSDGVGVHMPVITARGQGQRAPAGPGIVPIEVAALDDAGLERSIAEAKPDVVINLAAAGVDPAARIAATLLDGNAGIVARLLGAAAARPPRLIIHAGSWSEYADPVGGELLGEEHPLRPRSLYGAAKAAAELYGAALADHLGLGFITLRLFNVFGIGEAPHRLLPFLADHLSRAEPADLTAGTQARDFVYVSDAVDAIVTAMHTEDITRHGSYNVCSGRGTTVRRFAEMVADEVGAPHDLLRFGALPQRQDEPARIVGDSARLGEATGWRTTIDLRDGIARSVSALRAHTATGGT